VERQRYKIEWFRGSIKPENLVNINEYNGRSPKYSTTVRAWNPCQAQEFGRMRRPGLIVVVTQIFEKEKQDGN
jgi:hypothetical protein